MEAVMIAMIVHARILTAERQVAFSYGQLIDLYNSEEAETRRVT